MPNFTSSTSAHVEAFWEPPQFWQDVAAAGGSKGFGAIGLIGNRISVTLTVMRDWQGSQGVKISVVTRGQSVHGVMSSNFMLPASRSGMQGTISHNYSRDRDGTSWASPSRGRSPVTVQSGGGLSGGTWSRNLGSGVRHVQITFELIPPQRTYNTGSTIRTRTTLTLRVP